MNYFSGGTAPPLVGANDIPAPVRDEVRDLPPKEVHQTVAEFVKEAPAARYIFDSRLHYTEDGKPTAELCRAKKDGHMDCIELVAQSTALFKTMQQLGFFCVLPAEPTRTHMLCDPIPRS